VRHGQIQIAAHHVGDHRDLRGTTQRLGVAGRRLRAQLRALGGAEQAQVPDRFDTRVEVGVDRSGILHLLGAGRDFRQEARIGRAGDNPHGLQAQRGLLQVEVAGDGLIDQSIQRWVGQHFPPLFGVHRHALALRHLGPGAGRAIRQIRNRHRHAARQCETCEQRAGSQHCLQGESAPRPGHCH